MDIRIVCFDLGGVLVRICRTIDEAAGRVGLTNAEPEGWGAAEERERRSNVVRRYHGGQLTCEAYYQEFAGASLGRFTPDEVKALHAAWLWGEYPGVAQLISEINRLPGVHTACLSNTAQAHWAPMLQYAGVSQLKTRLASHLMRLVKPDPEIYLQAARELGVLPQQVLFFDDLEVNVVAAAEQGMLAVRVDPAQSTAPQIRAALRAHGLDVSLTGKD